MFTNGYCIGNDGIGLDTDVTKLRRKELLTFFDCERLSWLEAGMSEAAIFQIHFGEDGKGGDYSMWLVEHKHKRSDHKYAPGYPISLDDIKFEGVWFQDHSAADLLLSVEVEADIVAMLQILTPKQRALLEALIFDGITCADFAQAHGLDKSTVARNLERARKALKKYF